jgi:hypothetical protein
MKMPWTIIAAAIAVGALVSAAQAGSITLTGPTTKSGTYSPSDLATIGSANPSLVVTNGGLTGISLWGLLGGATASSPTSPVYGSITTSTPPGHNGKNSILRYYVVGLGTYGSQSVVSGGQIDPSFARPVRRFSSPTRTRAARSLRRLSSSYLAARLAVRLLVWQACTSWRSPRCRTVLADNRRP